MLLQIEQSAWINNKLESLVMAPQRGRWAYFEFFVFLLFHSKIGHMGMHTIFSRLFICSCLRETCSVLLVLY